KRDRCKHVTKRETGWHVGNDVIRILVSRAVVEEMVVGGRKVLVTRMRRRKSPNGGRDATLELKSHRCKIRHRPTFAVAGHEEVATRTGLTHLSLSLGEQRLPDGIQCIPETLVHAPGHARRLNQLGVEVVHPVADCLL